MTLVASLAGGDCIDDADALRTGGTARTLQGAIHPGNLLRLPLGRRSPTGPGEPGVAGTRLGRWGRTRRLAPDQTWTPPCETYGLAKEGARHHGYTGKRGFAGIAAGTGDVLMCRLREGRANTARGAAHFLRETVGRVRRAGASGQLTVRADSGFYTHSVVSVAASWTCASPSPSASTKACGT